MPNRFDCCEMLENMPLVGMRLAYEDNAWKIQYVSQNIEKYGFRVQEILDGRIQWENMLHPDDRIVTRKLTSDYIAKRLDDFKLRYRMLTQDKRSIWVTNYAHVNRNPDDSVASLDSFIQDTAEAKIDKAAEVDHIRQQVVLNDILLSLQDADLDTALQIILDRTGSYLNTSRVLLFKNSPDHKTCKVAYEWLNKGITSVKDLDHAVTYNNEMSEIYVALQNTGMLLVNAGEIPKNYREEFEKEGLVSSAIFAVYLHGAHYGFVCFDDCVIERTWDEETANFLKNIASLISAILMRIQTQEQLKITQRTCETVLDNIDSYIFAAHPYTNEIVFANRSFRQVFGNECIGRKASEFLPLPPLAEQTAPQATTRRLLSSGYEIFLKRTEQWLSVTSELVPWVDGQTVCLVNCYDITVKKQYEENIKRLAFTDHLTGLPNRYRCDVDLENSLESARRTGQTGYLLFIDLDDFKIINDCYGHDYGDGVLESFARYIRDLFRGDNHVFRFGGDEFVIIVNHGNSGKLQSYLDELLKRVKEPWQSLDKEFYCSLSIGVVAFPDDAEDAKTIVKKADIAMYHAKKSGKNNYAFYREGLDCATMERSEMEAMLRHAMQNGFQGFEVYYQTYSDAAEGRIVGAEALVRMRAGDGTLLIAEQFIELAEYLGFLAPLGEFVLAKAAEQCRQINESGHKDFSMTVNLSVKQFKQKDIVARLERILQTSGVDLRNMIISVDEEVAIGELDRMLVLCSELRKKGVRVALDDFGSGSSSFLNMRNLPVDIVKVSSRYIERIDDQFTGHFLRLITELAHSSGKVVCMNGVESAEQLAYCRELGIDQVQGFLLHRPSGWQSLRRSLAKDAPKAV